MTDPFGRLHTLVRLFQKRNRFISEAYEAGVTLAESHALTEISGSPGMTGYEAGQALMLPKSAAFRMLRRLKDRGLITADAVPGRGRRTALKISRKGQKVLDALDASANKLLEQFCRPFNPQEIEKILRFHEMVADSLGAPSSILRPSDHMLRPALRRFTRAVGLLLPTYMNSKLTVLEWHVLSEIAEGAQKRFARELCGTLNTAQNTMSHCLSGLGAKGLIRGVPGKDRRSRLLEVNARGRRTLSEIQAEDAKRLAAALSTLSKGEIHDVVTLMERFSGGERARGTADRSVQLHNQEVSEGSRSP